MKPLKRTITIAVTDIYACAIVISFTTAENTLKTRPAVSPVTNINNMKMKYCPIFAPLLYAMPLSQKMNEPYPIASISAVGI